MVAAISAHHRNNFSYARGDRERSLFRSLSTIYHSPPVHQHQASNSSLKINLKSILRRRSVGVDTNPPPSRNSISNNRSSPTLIAAKSRFFHDELPPLPFSKDGNKNTVPQPQSQGPSLATNSSKFQRLYSPLTAEMAQKMVTGLATEMRHQRTIQQHLKKARTNSSPPQTVPTETGGEETRSHRGFRPDYLLGDTARCPSHIITDQSTEEAMVSSLKKHDFAFVKRSNGTHSYAILAKRSVEPIKGKGKEDTTSFEECMTFAISDIGTTKTIREKHWSEFVRLVRPFELATRDHSPLSPSLEQQQQHLTSEEYGAVHHTITQQQVAPPVVLCEVCMPSLISFVPEDFDDECSLISSVSDRARNNAR